LSHWKRPAAHSFRTLRKSSVRTTRVGAKWLPADQLVVVGKLQKVLGGMEKAESPLRTAPHGVGYGHTPLSGQDLGQGITFFILTIGRILIKTTLCKRRKLVLIDC
jgi:hypothetical protein